MTGGQRRAPQGLISAWSAAEATVDGEGARGDHRRCVGGQIERRVGDLVRGRVPGQRDHAVEDLGGLCLWQTGRLHLDGVLERGRGRPRVEGVDPDLAVGNFLRRRPHESYLAVLGSNVRADLREPDEAYDAGRDDHAAAIGEPREPVLEDVEGATDVYRQGPSEYVSGVFDDRAHRAADAGIAEQRVQTPEVLVPGLDGVVNCLLVGHVGDRGEGAVGSESIDRFLEFAPLDADQVYPGSLADEELGGREPDTALSSSDQSDLVL